MEHLRSEIARLLQEEKDRRNAIAFAGLSDIVWVDAQGVPKLNVTTSDPEKFAALKSFKLKIHKRRGTGELRVSRSYKMMDKVKALEPIYKELMRIQKLTPPPNRCAEVRILDRDQLRKFAQKETCGGKEEREQKPIIDGTAEPC
ncbi:hypothetical protein RAZWK3B_00030 [Roseobacter sp. AzwK-3b]|uniref:hypothetical protein n=1 Tax=Roseobacter sp. AzwK-3b TaxID=351016 RepID=UPI000156A850|nr:hypothetical protein [Roseobacter sp. AzwK-3b]EDM69889.1 hypothetical protein RAZWK3B_00030 [Roseobacter sp. AzwK-3b]